MREAHERPVPLDACHAAYDEHSDEYARVLDPTLVGIVDRLAARARGMRRTRTRPRDGHRRGRESARATRRLAFNVYTAER